MADFKESRESIGEQAEEIGRNTAETSRKVGTALRGLTVSVDVDVSDALTGLKAVQREAKEATKALRELEETRQYGKVTDEISAGRGDIIISYTHAKYGEMTARLAGNARILIVRK